MDQYSLELIIDSESSGQRIDKYLAQQEKIQTRTKAAKLINLHFVLVNGKNIKPSYLLVEGDNISITLDASANIEGKEIKPLKLDLDIVFEDDDLIVLNKPSGLVVHPATSHKDDTLVNALVHYTSSLSMGVNEKRPGIVHRIDKDTSGLLVVAKKDSVHQDLAKQFRYKTTYRKYWAIVFGSLNPNSGTIESFLARNLKDRKKVSSFKDPEQGKHAVTHYKTLKSANNGLSWVELQLETGRTHQIRVHLSEKGHPIAGDVTYCGNGYLKNLKSLNLRKRIEEMDRFALHATELGFKHPRTGEGLKFSVDWPENLHPLLEHCKFI